jgi:hypothetical protein
MYIHDGLAALTKEVEIPEGLVLVKGEKRVGLTYLDKGTRVVSDLEMTDHGTSPLGHTVDFTANDGFTLGHGNVPENPA